MKIDVSASFDPHVVLTEKLDGKAVIVGDKILTACHCIPLDFDREDRELTLQTDLIVKLQSASGDLFPANIEFADPISDVAILGTPDAQAFSGGASLYEDCVSCSPIEVYFGDLPSASPCRSATETGVGLPDTGTAELFPNHRIFVETEKEILPGPSGGPIVFQGNLIAVVSSTNEDPDDGVFNGVHPLLAKTLPRWWNSG